MTASHMLWPKPDGEPHDYKDGVEVPRRTYRCKATAEEPDRLGRTHHCKRVIDHAEDEHACICNKKWEPVAA